MTDISSRWLITTSHLLQLLHYLIFVPRIVMMATYTQCTQTPIITVTNNSIQTDRSTLNTSATQTQPFQTNQAAQTFPQQNTQAIQRDIQLNEKLALDSTNSSTCTDVLDEVVLVNKPNSNRKRKTHKDHNSNKCSSTKQRKKVTYPQDQQNSSEHSDNNISTSEITPILQTYEHQLETFQMSQNFGTLTTDSRAINFSYTDQPLAQTVSYHNELQPMSTQKKTGNGSSRFYKFLW